MKNTYSFTLKLVFALVLSVTNFTAFSQTEKQRAQIKSTYNIAKIEKLKAEYTQKFKAEKAEAIALAKINGWEVYKRNSNGTFDELMSVTPKETPIYDTLANGKIIVRNPQKPIYYSLDNVNAAKSTRANTLNTGGILGLQLDGQNMFSGVWDGGPVRTTHQEFGGRVAVGDGTTTLVDNSFHATHVTGTVCAAGVQANAKGMASQATVKTFDWNNDNAEVLAEAENGLLLSNHSYGIPLESVPGNWYAGAYSGPAFVCDQIARAVPYYLMVASAGNDGNTTNPAPTTTGYDKLTGNKNAKNILVVANCQDANVDAQGNLISVSINSSSSEGPTDDRRVKPDITGNGTGLTSSTSTTDSSYGSLSGTSMASPNVMGTLMLVQQHYNNVNNHFMKAATLKGLACHTADDKGKVGPDPVWGWGLLNAKKAAQTITGNGLTSWVSEETLHQGETFTFTAQSDGVNPLLASISWTDVPGTINDGTLNSATPVLVNDLDIRITKDGNTYYPWKLQSDANLAAINTEDNNVDNVERINVPSAAGTYTITVTHKGTLQDGPQDFAFVVTGLSSAFSMVATSEGQTACLEGSATYDFNFANSGTTPTSFSATGLPNGAVATFIPPTRTTSGPFTMTISNLQNAVPGVYPVSVIGDNGTETETRTAILKVSSTDFGSIALDSPANAQTGVSTSLHLSWEPIENADAFHVQVATDANFTTIVSEGNSNSTDYNLTGLNESTFYYWRVFPINNCGEGTVANVFNFQTGQLVCDHHFEANDYVNAAIADTGSAQAIMQFSVNGGIVIGDINVSLNITHTYIGDLTVILEGPAALGFPKVTLLNEPCGEFQNIDCTLDDSATALTCSDNGPAVTGFVLPYQSLSTLNNLNANGVWTIYVKDPYPGDGGIVNFAAIDFCTVQAALGVKENALANFSVYPNPTKGLLNIHLNGNFDGKTTLTLFDIQGRNILRKQTASDSETLNIDNLQNGVYLLSIENGNQKATKKVVLSK